MKRIMNKKVAAIGLAAGLALGVAGGAFAYFTTTGNGNGSATVGTATNDWNVTTDPAVLTGDATGLQPQPSSCLPGSAASGSVGTCSVYETVAYHVKNTSSGQLNLSKVVVNVDPTFSATNAAFPSEAATPCTAADFSVDGGSTGSSFTDTTLSGDLAAGAIVSGTIGIVLVDNGAPQDNCQGQTVPLLLAAS